MALVSGFTTIYVRDAFGNLAAEYTTGGSYPMPCSTCYLSWDHLGSTRMVTDGTTGLPVPYGRHDYLPFGYEVPAGLGGRTDGIWPGSGTDSLTAKYTGAERDTETGFDFLQARYHASVQGRLMSPDPFNAGADIGNPQSWNGYSYVGNNPMAYVDPSGMFTQVPCNSQGVNPIDGSDFCDSSGLDDGGGDDGDENVGFTPPGLQAGGFTTYAGITSITDSEGMHSYSTPPVANGACVAQGLRSVIARGEGTYRRPNGGYGTVALGKVIKAPAQFADLIGTINAQIANPADLTGHPNILVQVRPGLTSTAFGRYQILAGTAAGLHLNDFSPAGQDAAADTLMRRRNMIAPALAGSLEQAIRNGGLEWASLPGSPYGQPTISMATALSAFSAGIANCK